MGKVQNSCLKLLPKSSQLNFVFAILCVQNKIKLCLSRAWFNLWRRGKSNQLLNWFFSRKLIPGRFFETRQFTSFQSCFPFLFRIYVSKQPSFLDVVTCLIAGLLWFLPFQQGTHHWSSFAKQSVIVLVSAKNYIPIGILQSHILPMVVPW